MQVAFGKHKKKLQHNFQGVLSRGKIKLKKVEPHDQGLKKNKRAQKQGLEDYEKENGTIYNANIGTCR
jgi:hypothetical protein